MSCLSKSHRIKTQKEFNQIYKSNKKWHTHSFVVFFNKHDSLKVAFVSSKKVGNAIARSKSKRLLKALMLQNENQLKIGKYVFVAKNELLSREFQVLQKDFYYAMKKLDLFQ
ncbi:MAG: ribonuclease P protein component [Campylobacterales bacterium]|nr:ribonuclease P protein component [Campylobacterales bacterium]